MSPLPALFLPLLVAVAIVATVVAMLDGVWRAATFARREEHRLTPVAPGRFFLQRSWSLVVSRIVFAMVLATGAGVLLSLWAFELAATTPFPMPVWVALLMGSLVPAHVALLIAIALLYGLVMVNLRWGEGQSRPYHPFVVVGGVIVLGLWLVVVLWGPRMIPGRWHEVAWEQDPVGGAMMTRLRIPMFAHWATLAIALATWGVVAWHTRWRRDFLEHWEAPRD